MDFLPKLIQEYCEHHTDVESEVLKKLTRETYAKVLMPRMLSGHLQGRLLSLLSKLIAPNNILEIGTYTGYSAICLAEGLSAGGKLITIDINEELEDFVKDWFDKAGIKDIVNYIIGDAMEVIPELSETFDMVFIDADKINYQKYYNLIIEKVRPGGVIIADNVLWSGKVVGEKTDKDTKALMDFNQFVQNDVRVENMLLPLRDGLMIIRKK
ncbi:MAG: O-methyltransferase [Cytophagaceae bacterium]